MGKQEILEKYPSLYREKDLPMDKSCMHWGLDVPEDWLPVIDKLSEVLSNPPVENYETSKNWRLLGKPQFNWTKPTIIAKQVKIKYGELRFYYQIEFEDMPEDLSNEQKSPCYRAAGRFADGAIAMASAMCEGKPYLSL